jgi:hypothetical protein
MKSSAQFILLSIILISLSKSFTDSLTLTLKEIPELMDLSAFLKSDPLNSCGFFNFVEFPGLFDYLDLNKPSVITSKNLDSDAKDKNIQQKSWNLILHLKHTYNYVNVFILPSVLLNYEAFMELPEAATSIFPKDSPRVLPLFNLFFLFSGDGFVQEEFGEGVCAHFDTVAPVFVLLHDENEREIHGDSFKIKRKLEISRGMSVVVVRVEVLSVNSNVAGIQRIGNQISISIVTVQG